MESKQNNSVVTLLSVLLLISVFIAGFFAYRTQNLVKEITKLRSTATPIAITTLTPKPTVDWMTFVSKNLNLSFQYPSYFVIKETVANPSPVGYMVQGRIDLGKFSTTLTSPPTKDISIITMTNKEAKYFLNINVGTKFSDPNLNQGFTTTTERLPDEFIGGLKSYVYKDYATDTDYYPSKIYIIEKDNIFYKITIPNSNFWGDDLKYDIPGKDLDYLVIYNQILSTFKFIETVPTSIPNPNINITCTMDAKLCDDGSYVGRSGLKCEFTACPTTSPQL